MVTWALTIEQLEELSRTYCKQLMIIWSDENKKNNQLCRKAQRSQLKKK